MLWIARMLGNALVRRKINQTCELMWVEITLDAEVDVGGVGRHCLSERRGVSRSGAQRNGVDTTAWMGLCRVLVQNGDDHQQNRW